MNRITITRDTFSAFQDVQRHFLGVENEEDKLMICVSENRGTIDCLELFIRNIKFQRSRNKFDERGPFLFASHS